MRRALGRKVAALALSLALGALFVAHRIASARAEAGTPSAAPAAPTGPSTRTLAPEVAPPPTYMGGSKSLILVDPTTEKPSDEPTIPPPK